MILFKITSAPDKSQLGVYQHETLNMVIGNANADMVIDDPDISERQVEITHKKGQFFITNLNKRVPVKLNGSEISTKPTPIKSNDSIAMGGTMIFFTQLSDKALPMPPRYSNENNDTRLSREGAPEHAILRALDFLSGDGISTTVGSETQAQPPPKPPKKG